MGRAPTFIAPKFGGSGNISRPTDASGDRALGAAIQDVGSLAAGIGLDLARKQTAIRANKKISQFKQDAANRGIEARKAAGPGAEGFTPQFMEQFDSSVQELLDSAKGNAERQLMEISLDRYRATTFESALEFEATAGVIQRKLDLQDSIDLTANSIRSNPEQFEDGLREQLGTLDTIRADMPPTDELQLEESINQKLAVAAVQGEIDLAPGLALQRLQDGHWDKFLTPAQKNALINKAQSSANTVDKVARNRWNRMVEDHLASIKVSDLGVSGVNFDGATAVFGNTPERDVVVGNLERAEKVASSMYAINGKMSTGTPQERRDTVDELTDLVLAGGVGSVDNQTLLGFATDRFTEVQKGLEEDPVADAINSPVVQKARDEGLIAGVEAANAEQIRRGIPPDLTRVQTELEIKSRVLDLQTGDASVDLQSIAALRNQYGPEHFPRVMSELIGGGLDPLITMLDTIALNDPAMGVKVLETLRVKLSDLKSQFNSSETIPYSDVELAVQAITVPMMEALAGNSPGRLAYVVKWQQLITRVAALDIIQGGFDSPIKAVEKAYNMMFGDHYLLQGSYYLPKADHNNITFDTEKIIDFTENSLRSIDTIKQMNIDPSVITLEDGVPKSVSHEVTSFLFSNNGEWINTADGKGLQLVTNTSRGISVARRLGTQEPYIMSFRELERAGQVMLVEKLETRKRAQEERALRRRSVAEFDVDL